MRKTLFVLCIHCIAIMVVHANEYIVGTGTTSTNWAPVRATYDYGWSRMLYTKAELNAAGLNSASDIPGISFNIANTPENVVLPNQMIYMRHTTAAEMTGDYPDTADYILVYNAEVRFHGSDWKYIEFDTPFTWNNTDNLEIMWENHQGYGSWGYPSFRITSTAPVCKTAYFYDMNTFPTGSGNLMYGRPNLRISTPASAIPAPTVNPGLPAGAVWVSPIPELTWQNGGGVPVGFKLYLGTVNPPPYLADLEYSYSWSPIDPLQYNQLYYWQIVPYNAFGDAVNCPVWSFTTVTEGAIQIGTGLYEQNQPFDIGSGYERSTALYTAAQLENQVGILDEIGWDCTSDFTDTVPYKIYFKSTTDTQLTFRSWDEFLTGAVLVKQGVYQFDSIGWHTFILDTGFHYISGNVIVGVETNYGGTGTSPYPYFRFSTGTANTHQYWEQDYTPPLGSGELNAFVPNVRLHITTPPVGALQPPILIYPPDEAVMLPQAGFDFVWSPNLTGGIPLHYDLFISHYEGSLYHQHQFSNITSTSFNPAINGSIVFSYGEHCEWKVRAENAFGQAIQTDWNQFEIEPDPTVQIPHLQTFDLLSFPPGWIQRYSENLPSNRWLPSLSGNAGGTACELTADWCDGIGISRLISPPINTGSLNAFNVTFKHNFVDYAAGLNGRLQFSHDRFNWQDTGWNFNSGNGDLVGAETVLIYLGTPAPVTYLSWTLEGDHWQFWNWYLDDVALSVVMNTPEVIINAYGMLSWQAVTGAVSYNIYGSADPYGNFELLDSTTLITWQDSAFPQERKFYRVTSMDAFSRRENTSFEGVIRLKNSINTTHKESKAGSGVVKSAKRELSNHPR